MKCLRCLKCRQCTPAVPQVPAMGSGVLETPQSVMRSPAHTLKPVYHYPVALLCVVVSLCCHLTRERMVLCFILASPVVVQLSQNMCFH